MSPVNSRTCHILRPPGTINKLPAKSYSKKFVPVNSTLKVGCETLAVIENKTKVSQSKKQDRFANPLHDSNLNFKGFTTDQVSQMDEVRSKMETIRKALILNQKTAVTKAICKNHGVVSIKCRSIKAFLFSKKLCPKPSRAVKTKETQPMSAILQHGKLLRNDLNLAKMIMMQCRVCCRKAYFPRTQQNISSANLDSFICHDCFEKSKSIKFNCAKPFANDTEKNAGDQILEEFDDDKPIIITSVRSLSTQNAVECQNNPTKTDEGGIDLEPMSSTLQNKSMQEEVIKSSSSQVDLSADRDEENENTETGVGKEVNVWTAEGYFTFVVPNNFEDQTDAFKLVSGQKRGTADDPILLDDN